MLAAALAVAGTAGAATYATEAYMDAGTGQQTGNAGRFGPSNAVGAPDGDFFSLGLGGRALFTFGGDIVGPGTVIEVTFGCSSQPGTCPGYDESAEIYGVTGPITLQPDGMVGGEQNYDLSGLSTELIDSIPNGSAQGPGGFVFSTGASSYAGLLLVDTSPMVQGRDGFDVAAVMATLDEGALSEVPLPPAAPLLLGALVGLRVLARRKA